MSLTAPQVVGVRKGGIALFIIDPQNDFHEGGSLAVPGAMKDSERIAALINQKSADIYQICVTLDSHHKMDLNHASMWLDADGKNPGVFTEIAAADIKAGKFKTAREDLRDYSLEYATALEKGGRFKIMIWPDHCLIGTQGHNVVPVLNNALQQWCTDNLEMVNYYNKADCIYTESYSALKAEVQLTNDAACTQLNQKLLDRLLEADKIYICGEAASHCVRYSVEDFVNACPAERIKDVYLLEDCTSPVTGFEEPTKGFLKAIQEKGVTLVKSTDLLN